MRRLLLLVLAAPLAAQNYVVSNLDGTPNPVSGSPFAISRTGDIAAGLASPPGFGFGAAARWLGHGTSVLPMLPGDEASDASGVNDAGTVVGQSTDVVQVGSQIHFTFRGVVWQNGQPTLLSDLATSGDTDIVPINGVSLDDYGRIVGQGRRTGVQALRGFLLEGGVMTDLGSLTGTLDFSVTPAAMNEQRVVVGAAEAPDHFNHAFVWKDGVMTDLHTLAGVPGRNSHAAAINEAGVIVGDADPVADFLDYQNAAVWENGVVTFLPDLGDVGGVIESFARDINDHGTIVGTSITPSFEVHAVTWRNGQCVDLNTLIPPNSGWSLANAYAISNDGRIVGEGFTSLGLQAFELVPDSAGGFEVYGAGCAGSGGYVPGLWGQGWPNGGGDISLAVTNGLGGAAGLLLVGLGNQMASFKGCTLFNLPLSSLSVPLALTPGGPGGGQWTLPITLPASVPTGSLFLQAALLDAGAPHGVTLSNAVRLDLGP
jgi:probable HAF family extracellular repeat protein